MESDVISYYQALITTHFIITIITIICSILLHAVLSSRSQSSASAQTPPETSEFISFITPALHHDSGACVTHSLLLSRDFRIITVWLQIVHRVPALRNKPFFCAFFHFVKCCDKLKMPERSFLFFLVPACCLWVKKRAMWTTAVSFGTCIIKVSKWSTWSKLCC